jgi:hypothetical protein
MLYALETVVSSIWIPEWEIQVLPTTSSVMKPKLATGAITIAMARRMRIIRKEVGIAIPDKRVSAPKVPNNVKVVSLSVYRIKGARLKFVITRIMTAMAIPMRAIPEAVQSAIPGRAIALKLVSNQ